MNSILTERAQLETPTCIPLSVLIMTFNEEVNIEACLESVAGWAAEIVIVDSFSTDRTEEIAKRFSVRFSQHEYESAPAQWNWALSNINFHNEWIFAVDADFRVTPELRDALTRQLRQISPNVAGIYVRHRQVFRGRFIRHGTIYPRHWLRIFRRGAVSMDPNELVDQHFYVKGETRTIEFDVIEDNAKERDIRFWILKQIRFAERAAIEEIRRRKTGQLSPIKSALFGSPDQRTLWMKERWFSMPRYFRAGLYFMYRYFVRLGFLDGKEGFLYHFTQAFLYRVLVDTYIDDLADQDLTLEQLETRLKPLGPKR